MIKKFLMVFAVIGLLVFVPVVSLHAATSKDAVCEGAGVTEPGSMGCSTPSGTADGVIQKAVKTGLNMFSLVAGVISVVMIMIAGIKYMTSGGDSGKVASAQNTVLYAAIGIVVVVMAQVIVKFVIGRFI